MSKSIPQLTEKTSLSTGDLFHIVRSNIDYKIKKENVETELAGAISKTGAQITALIATSDLIQGRFYNITDLGDAAGSLFQATSTNSISLLGNCLFWVPDYQDVGLQTGNMKGVWHSGLAGLTANVSIAIYNGLHYRNLTGNVGTAPSGDAVNWVALAKTLANGYILDNDTVLIDQSNNFIWRKDKRGNHVFVNFDNFQFGNNNVTGNTFVGDGAGGLCGVCTCINQRGVIKGNTFINGIVNFSNAHEGDHSNNIYSTGSGTGYILTASANSGVTVYDCKFNYIGTNTSLPSTLSYQGAYFDFDLQYTVPLTGQTKTALANTRKFIIDPAAGIAALTITLDATNLYDGKTIELYFTQTITALTVNGGTVVGALPAGIAAAGLIKLVYYENTSFWYY